MTAGQIETWRAWYDLEPRGDERADVLTAMLALANAKEGTTVLDIVQMIRDLWTPITPKEEKRRKREKSRRWQSRLNEFGRKMMDDDRKVKRGKQ